MRIPDEIKNVAVVGAGLMGHGIALEFAANGRKVSLQDQSEHLLVEAMQRVHVGLLAMAQSARISGSEVDAAIKRIATMTDLSESVREADLVIEAITEDLDLKRSVFRKIDHAAPRHAVLVSNTSTFLPSAIASATSRPGLVAGTHYYNPPHLLPGVEIVLGPETSAQTARLLFDLFTSIGKKPAVVDKEIQGFIGNRLQVAMLREAMALVRQGIVSPSQADAVVRYSFGRLLSVAGLFELADSTGLDMVQQTADKLLPTLSNDRQVSSVLLEKIESGNLGVKTGKGFYDWSPSMIESWRKKMASTLLSMASRDQ